MGALFRIQKFVDAALESRKIEQSVTYDVTKGHALEVDDASFAWSSDAQVVSNVDFKLAQGQCLAITGPVGSGKSTLLAGLLDMTPRSSGKISRESLLVSYCPQDPWLFSGSVRDNIVCGIDFEQAWFDVTIAACALSEDLKRWEQAELHDVGNDGCHLSGGQRQRVVRHPSLVTRAPSITDVQSRP